MEKKAKQQYNNLLKNGILLEVYDTLTGVWEEDKSKFLDIYETEQFYTSNLEIIEDDYYDEE